MGEKYFQEFASIFFMGEKYFQEFASNFSWVKHIFRNLVPIFGSPELVGTLPQALFFSQKNGPIFLEALSLWVCCRRRFFFQKNGPHIFTSPELLGTLPQALFFPEKCPPYFWKP